MQVTGNHAWHSYSLEKINAILETNRSEGLTSAQVNERQQTYGPNALPEDDGFGVISAVLKQLRSPLSLVLILAGLATIFLGEFLDAIVVFAALTINVVIGVIQEGKAARVFDALAKQQETHTTVLRSGTKHVVLSHELVPGDVVELPAGAAIPADVRLIETTNLRANESALTGEWMSVEKQTASLSENVSVAEQKNMAWMGTLVTEGSGMGIVVATGSEARFGAIAESTQEAIGASLTPLQQSIRRIARFLIGVIAVALVIILALGVLRGEPFAEMLLLAIAVAVAAMPEGLPAAVTVVLALGMESILKKGGLVKNLLAAETLGSTTVILTDKTGTLTQGRMKLSGVYSAQGAAAKNTAVEGDNKEVLMMAILASDAFIENETGGGEVEVHGRPLEKAIVECGINSQLSQRELFHGGHSRIDFVPFDTARRFAISLNESAGKGNRLYFSGSPEHLLALSSHYYKDGKVTKLDEETRKHFADIQKELSAEGMRFTGVAYMDVSADTVPDDVKNPKGKQQFVFGGLLSFADAVREDVAASIATAKEAGAQVIMATGDYPETARAIAYEVGITGEKDAEVLTGTDVEALDDAELLDALKRVKIFARVLPEQKLRIAHVLKNTNEVVAMTGDGVNDAPTLAAADIGVAVGSGTEVAKAAADLVLIENSFSVITAAIAEGRRVIANLRKIIAYLLSTSFSEIIVIGGALAAGAPLPFLPTQILWANIVGEGFMSFPFAFEPKEKGVMKHRPERRGVANILTSSVKKFILIVSVVTSILLLGVFFLMLWLEAPIEKIRTIMFVALSIYSMFFAFSFKDLKRPIWNISLFSNRYLIGALIASFITLVVVITFPPLQKLLTLTPLTFAEVILLVVLGAINLAVVETAKHFFMKRSA